MWLPADTVVASSRTVELRSLAQISIYIAWSTKAKVKIVPADFKGTHISTAFQKKSQLNF